MDASGKSYHSVRRVDAKTSALFLIQEAKALNTRLEGIEPFALNIPRVGAAEIDQEAQKGIHQLLARSKQELNLQIKGFTFWLERRADNKVKPKKMQAVFSLLKLRFNALLDKLDIFADVLNQRAEQDTGVRLAGLDALAKDSLEVGQAYFKLPPMICYLDRGHGAAIRRARTRLPGGKKNPVAVIRVPRERMVGSGIASSLIHEVGHQGAALLDLVNSMLARLQGLAESSPDEYDLWMLYRRWISEILADFWAIAQLGVGSTLGLIGVVTLPRYFVFRLVPDKPHPFPWIRVKISCAVGKRLYPDSQWDYLAQQWEKFYPLQGLPKSQQKLIKRLEALLPKFVEELVNHRPVSLRGKRVRDIFPVRARQPARLRQMYQNWQERQISLKQLSPVEVFATLGQARADRKLDAKAESQLINQLLRYWALSQALSQH